MDNPCGLQFHMSRSGLTVPGRLVTAIGEWVLSGPLIKSMARNNTERVQPLERLPICLGNTRKYPGEKGEGRTTLSMAWTALKADVVQKSVSWEFKGRDERPLHGSYHYSGYGNLVGVDHGLNHQSVISGWLLVESRCDNPPFGIKWSREQKSESGAEHLGV
ncbi:hypothetical protein DY000_02052018 [Brassica cretica]|uniref:Uncharacterized protein n=1 Tax=Brassica cretica TaxID=69181 RepID=A0ABQ7AEF2_BRACR|nr:hypothetical protein DY000_02052018 [Brassica cretica]